MPARAGGLMCVASFVCALAWSAVSFADAPLPPPSEIAQWSSNRRYVAVADPKRDALPQFVHRLG